MILNDITKDNNKVLYGESKKNTKFHRLERSTEEVVYILQSVVELEQQNGGHQKKLPLAENENPSRMSNKEQVMDQATRIRKGVEGQPIS